MNSPSSHSLRHQIGQIQGLKIIVIGDFILDHFIFGSVHRQSPEAPVSILDIESETLMPGGRQCCNQFKKLGCYPIPFGIRGEDEAGEMLVKYLADLAIPTEGLHLDRHRPTTTKTRLIELPNQHRIRYDREVRTPLKPILRDALIRSILDTLPNASAVLISDYAKGVVDQDLVDQIHHACKSQNKLWVVDPKPQHKDFTIMLSCSPLTPRRLLIFRACLAIPMTKLNELEERSCLSSILKAFLLRDQQKDVPLSF